MTDLEALNLLIATGDKVTSARLDYLQQTLGVNKLFLSEEFNQLKKGLRYLRDNSGFDPSTADLSEFLNESEDPYVRESELLNTSNKHIFSWWGGNWNTVTLNRWYYIGFNGGLIEFVPGATDLTTISQSMTGRNKGLFIAPFDCKIKRVLFKDAGSGSYTGKFALASGLPNYGTTWNIGYSNVVIHLNEVISSGGFWQNKFEFLVTDEITVPKGYVISPMLTFSAQAQAGKNSIDIQIEIEEI
jgi:hypothetical protein